MLAMLYNINRGRSQPVRMPRDFHPMAERRRRGGMRVSDLHALRDAFPVQHTITLPPGEWLPT